MAAAQEIGSVAAAAPIMEGAPPGAEARTLEIGTRVVSDERLTTSESGAGQLLFNDGTTLDVAPGTDLVLNRYIYDPEAEAGDIAAEIARGAVRVIGGAITKEAEATIDTPFATIGIRGGMALIVVTEDTLRVVFLAGDHARIYRGEELITLSRPGAGATIREDGSVAYDGVLPWEVLRRLFSWFEVGGGAGAAILPTEAAVIESGVSDYGFEELGGAFSKPVATSGGRPVDTGVFTPIEIGRDYLLTPTGLVPVAPFSGTGAAYFSSFASFTTDDGVTVRGPVDRGVFFAPGGGVTFVEVRVGSRIGVDEMGGAYVVPTVDGFFTFAEGEGSTPEGPAFGRGFFDENAEFTLARLDIDGGEGLAFSGVVLIGDATPGQLLDQTTAGDVPVRRYALDFAIDGASRGSLVPFDIVPLDAGVAGDLVIVGDPSGALFGGGGGVAEGAELGATKAFSAVWTVESGEGGARAYFGGFVSPVVSNGVAPTISADYFGFALISDGEGGGESVVVRSGVGTVEDNASDTQGGSTLFGPDGQYLALGTSARYRGNDDIDYDYSAGVADYLTDEGDDQEIFGFVALGVGAPVTTIDPSARFSAAATDAASLADFGFAANPGGGAPPVRAVFDGGFASEYSETEQFGSVSDRSHDRSRDGGGAFIQFDAEIGEATLALEGLLFGGGAGESAFIDEQTLAASQGFTSEGGATFSGFAASIGATGVPDIFPETAVFDRIEEIEPPAIPSGPAPITPAAATVQEILPVNTTPAFLTWGAWASTVEDPDGEVPTSVRRTGLWVAGDATRPEELPMRGTVRHSGFAAVIVSDSDGARLEGGGYQLTYDFEQRRGVAQFRDLAGYDIDADVRGVEDGGFTGDFAGVDPISDARGLPSVSGALDGAFFTGGGDPAAASAGSIGFASDGEGAQLEASGVFVGETYE